MTELVRTPVNFSPRDLKVGEYVTVVYGGEPHTVFVVPPLASQQEDKGWWRYVYAGRRYKTLSAIAAGITGNATMSGARFFGLWKRKRK